MFKGLGKSVLMEYMFINMYHNDQHHGSCSWLVLVVGIKTVPSTSLSGVAGL